ncbi:MAG: hypothetical protein WBM00_03340 [Solirubrobacterales bacterium]
MEAEVHQLDPERGLPRVNLQSRTAGLVLLGFAMAGSIALLLWVLHNAPFVEDEWGLLVRAQDASLRDVFVPWNGHLLAVGILIAKLSIALVGSQIWLLVALDIAGVIACSALVYGFARSRLGPVLAVAPALVPLFFSGTSIFYGTGIQLTPLLGINGIYSLDFGLAALFLVARERRRDDLLAAAMLTLSLASFSYGLAFAVGVAVAVLLSPGRWRRSFVVLAPLALYCVWLVWMKDQRTGASALVVENVPLVPLYIADSLAAVSAGLFGMQTLVGRGPAVIFAAQESTFSSFSFPLVLISAEVAVIVLAARALGRRGLARPSLWPPIATLAAMWTSQGLVLNAVSRMPGDPRYLFAGAVLLVIVVAEVVRGFRFSRFATIAILIAAMIGAVANVPRFREGKQLNDYERQVTRASAAMIELAGKHADPTFVPGQDLPEVSRTMWITAGAYLDFAARHGSMAESLGELQAADSKIRSAADRVLIKALDLRLRPGTRSGTNCRRLRVGSELRLPFGIASIHSSRSSRLALRRFGEKAIPVATIAGNQVGQLYLPPDRAAETPWVLSADGSTPVVVCPPPPRR